MIEPLVSIIIPVYNSELFLEDCISSVINQTWPNKQIIIVNDGSTDNSLKIARSFVSENITVIDQPNKGASAARNIGLKHSNGEYIQFLDADDLLSEGKLEEQVLALNGYENLVALCSTVHFLNGTDHLNSIPSPYEEQFLYTTNEPLKFLIKLWGGYDGKGSMVQPNAWLVPKQLIDLAGYWNEALTFDDDGEFFTRVLLNSNGIIRTGSCNYYRKYINGSNLSAINTYNGLKSLLNSTLSKKSQLFKRTNKIEAKMAIERLLMDVAICAYPRFPDLVGIAESNYTYPKKYNPELGGKFINVISKVFGWKLAKHLQHLKNA